MSNHHHNPFLNALPILANAIGDSVGVEVILNAGKAATNGEIIMLPPLKADDPHSKALGLGFISHEAAHVRFSDFGLKFSKPLEKHVYNILEDIRIEKAISQIYPGCAGILSDTVDALAALDKWEKPTEQSSPTEIMQSYMLYQLRLNVLGQKGVEKLAELAAKHLAAKVPLGMRVRLEALMYEVESCNSGKEVLDLTRAIINMMKDEDKKEEDKEKEKEQEKNQQQDSPQPDQSQDQSQNGDPKGDQDGISDSSEDDDGEPKSEGTDSGQSDDDSTQNKPSGENQANGQGDDDGIKASDIIKQILSASNDDAVKDAGELLQEVLGEVAATDSTPSSAAPFRNAKIDESNLPAISAANDEINRVAAASNALKVRAQSLLQAQTLGSTRSAFMGTKLNTKNLHMVKTGGPVFTKKTEGIKVDTAIEVLVDRSVSMRPRIGLAMDAALATTMAFDRQDVKTAVLTFPYSDAKGEANGVLKSWNQRPGAALPAYQSIGVEGTTPMAEAMMGACMEIMRRPEKRKILLVATDGEPDDKGKCKWVIDLARKSGIEVLGLGILHDAAPVFGSEWSGKIDNIAELPVAMIGMLDRVMLKKAA